MDKRVDGWDALLDYKKVLDLGDGGKQKRGRARKKWLDAVEQDIKEVKGKD